MDFQTRIGRAALFSLAAALALPLTGCGDEQIKRANEYLGVRDFGTAATELKVLLRKKPDHSEAASLLLYARTLEEGATGLTRYQATCLIGGAIVEATAEQTSTVESEKVAESKMNLRKELLDFGIETKDWTGAEKILRRATEYGFETEDLANLKVGELNERTAKAAFAGCLAALGDPRGLDFLTGRLRDAWGPEQRALLLLGPTARPFLQTVSATPEHLSKDAASELLMALDLGLEVRKFVEEKGPLDSLRGSLAQTLRSGKKKWASQATDPCDNRETVADGEIALDASVMHMVGSRADIILERNEKKTPSTPDSASYTVGKATLVALAGVQTESDDKQTVRLLIHRDGAWKALPVNDLNDRITGDQMFGGLCTKDTIGEGLAKMLGERGLSEDQILIRYYAGVVEAWRTKKTWYGPEKYKTRAPDWKWGVYHLGAESIQFVRDPTEIEEPEEAPAADVGATE
jgi:hypothetical protein